MPVRFGEEQGEEGGLRGDLLDPAFVQAPPDFADRRVREHAVEWRADAGDGNYLSERIVFDRYAEGRDIDEQGDD